MKLINYKDVPAEKVTEPGAQDVNIRWVISEKDKAPNFAMRVFEVNPGGFTPYHNHPWEHEVFIVNGVGVLITEGKKRSPFKSGDVIFVPGGENHQFKNNSKDKLTFLCMIPIQKK